MNITVKTADLARESESFPMVETDTVEHLKLKIQDSWGVPTHRQELLYEGKEMNNTEALSQYRISPTTTLRLNLTSRSIDIIVRHEATFEMFKSLDCRHVRSLKEDIHERLRIPISNQRLSFQDQEMDENRTVCDYYLGAGSTIEIVLEVVLQITVRGPRLLSKRIKVLGSGQISRDFKVLKSKQTSHNFVILESQQIIHFKHEISDPFDIPYLDLILVYNDKLMDNNHRFKDYDVKDGSTLELFAMDTKRTIEIEVRLKTGRSSTFRVSPSDTVANLESKVSIVMRGRIVDYMIYAGKKLEHHRMLKDYGIENGATLNIVSSAQHLPHPEGGPCPCPCTFQVELPNGSTMKVKSDTTQRVDDLKYSIEKICQIDRSRQRLVFKGANLDGNVRVKDLKFFLPFVLELRPTSNVPYSINVLVPGHGVRKLEVIASDSVGYVIKRILTEPIRLSIRRHLLRFQGIDLADSSTLAHCLVDNSDTLQLLPVDKSNDLTIAAILYFADGLKVLHVFRASAEDTIFKLKRKILEKSLVPVAEQEMSFLGESHLENVRTLDSYVSPIAEEDLHLARESLLARLLREYPENEQAHDMEYLLSGKLITLKVTVNDAGGTRVDDFALSRQEPSMISKSENEMQLRKSMMATDDFALPRQEPSMVSESENEIQLNQPVMATDDFALSRQEPSMVSKSENEIQLKQPVMATDVAEKALSHLHLLPHRAEDLLTGSWRDLLPLLPEYLRWDVEYNAIHRYTSATCWTLTPSSFAFQDVPFSIAGAPVIVPVEYRYPLMGPVIPPPDPHPKIINPNAPLSIETIYAISKDFRDSLGFFLLINGMLQIIVPEGFDYEWASSHQPTVFGGLKVCYICQSFVPTIDSSLTFLQTIPAGSASKGRSGFRKGFFSSQAAPSINLTPTLQLSQPVQARVKRLKSTERHAGRIGVVTTCDSKAYLTMSSHVITSAVFAKERQSIFSNWRSSSQSLNENWTTKAEIYANNSKLGRIAETFDPNAKDYPVNFIHDVSLIEPIHPKALSNAKSPIPDLGWLSQDGWNNLRQNTNNLHVLGDEGRKGKSMRSIGPSQCLIIGEGILLNRKLLSQETKHSPSEYDNLELWGSLIARSVLYRVSPDFEVPQGQSGVALYAVGDREDGSVGPGVAGFQSFVQMSGHVQTYEMEGAPLQHRLRKGLVAFYGAFQAPEKLRKEHVILC